MAMFLLLEMVAQVSIKGTIEMLFGILVIMC